MKTGIFAEYLGDISTELLMQNLTNTNPHFSSIDLIRESFPEGFTVSAEIERPFAETQTEKEKIMQEMRSGLQPKGKLVRLVLDAKEKADATAS